MTGVDDHVRAKVKHLLQRARAHVQQHLHAAGNALEVPDVRNRNGQFNVAHALAAHLCAGDFHAALFADNALVTAALVTSAVAFPVLRRPEDALAEQAVLFGFERAVVDRFRLFDLAMRPFQYLFGRSQPDLQCVKVR
ncbi:hypothetical protein SDC9_128764 [bioreactor metagenome]|uniref:Uncharacterized protein n=1 Tax=bioreactor metagenome TaxID=1076179 RepID=A0A645CXT2_9ZZZZ